MNMTKVYNSIAIFALLLCSLVGITSCTEQEEDLGVAYGYVQFKLYKNDTAPAATRALDYLHEAHKVKVTMQREGSTIEQTLVLNSYSNEHAAYGLRSDKLQLLVGEYKVVNYVLYDRLDKQLMSTQVASQFTVVADGLVTHNLSVDVTERGRASFRLVKPEIGRAHV